MHLLHFVNRQELKRAAPGAAPKAKRADLEVRPHHFRTFMSIEYIGLGSSHLARFLRDGLKQPGADDLGKAILDAASQGRASPL